MAERDPANVIPVDAATAELAQQLADALHTSVGNAVRIALEDKLERAAAQHKRRPAREILAEFLASHPRPAATGLKADKAFFDDLSCGM